MVAPDFHPFVIGNLMKKGRKKAWVIEQDKPKQLG